MIKLNFVNNKKTTIVRVAGELDLVAAEQFRTEIDSAMEKNCSDNIILNLDEVRFIDSSGLGVILGRYKKVKMRGGKMALVSAPAQVKRILELSGVLNIASSYKTENEALQAM
ncbi:MAG TPA: anti-sigma F factor antagonist [Desulfobacteria bacterium]|nr:anti-sigma F factor antagonist [Desulfobacteria bacterium]